MATAHLLVPVVVTQDGVAASVTFVSDACVSAHVCAHVCMYVCKCVRVSMFV